MIFTRIGVLSYSAEGSYTINASLPCTPTWNPVLGQVIVVNNPVIINFSAFGGAGSGSYTNASLYINGNTYNLYASQYQTTSMTVSLPIGTHNFTLSATFNGTSGNNTTIS